MNGWYSGSPASATELSRFAHTADGVCGIDGAGRIALWNPAAERILGYPAAEVAGKSCCEVFDRQDNGGEGRCRGGCVVKARPQSGELVEHFALVARTRVGVPIRLDMSVIVLPGRTAAQGATVHLFREHVSGNGPVAPSRSGAMKRLESPAERPGLTRREAEILGLLTMGCTTHAIATRLRVSQATVRNHVQSLLRKLGAHSRLEAVARVSHDPRE